MILLVYGPDRGDVQPTASISQHTKIISILRYSVNTLHKKCKRRLPIKRAILNFKRGCWQLNSCLHFYYNLVRLTIMILLYLYIDRKAAKRCSCKSIMRTHIEMYNCKLFTCCLQHYLDHVMHMVITKSYIHVIYVIFVNRLYAKLFVT